jgi:hypothetical protein
LKKKTWILSNRLYTIEFLPQAGSAIHLTPHVPLLQISSICPIQP